MKKDIEWLQDEIGDLATISAEFINDGLNYIDSAIPVANVYALIDQLDKPEVLSQKWIDDKTFVVTDSDGDDYAVVAHSSLQNLIVPKQEPPVIPKYMADFIRVKKYTDAYSLQYIFCIAMKRSEAEQLKKEYDWISANDETFARAWLDGYTVAEEQKYYVDLDTAAYVAKLKDDDRVDIYTDGISGSDEYEFHLTEEEIKNYDERFWPFAKPVK